MLRHVLAARIAVDVADVVDRAADGVEKRGAAADGVVLAGHGPYRLNVHTVVQNDALVVEQDGGHISPARLPLLLFQKGIEAADGVVLKAGHGAAAVKDKYEFGNVVFHGKSLLQICWHKHNRSEGGFGRLKSDIFFFTVR